jgi:hypothetical protein
MPDGPFGPEKGKRNEHNAFSEGFSKAAYVAGGGFIFKQLRGNACSPGF